MEDSPPRLPACTGAGGRVTAALGLGRMLASLRVRKSSWGKFSFRSAKIKAILSNPGKKSKAFPLHLYSTCCEWCLSPSLSAGARTSLVTFRPLSSVHSSGFFSLLPAHYIQLFLV